MKKITFYFLLLISFDLLSQNHVDALRYSYLEPLGTARFSSLGGSFSGLGGDLSSIHQNPAGLAIYRTDEIGFSLNSKITSNESSYFNSSYNNELSNFYIQNLGYVKTFRKSNEKWNRFSFGLTYNRLKDFNEDLIILGNSNESIINTFLNNSQNSSYENLNPFYEELAFNTYLIDTLNGEKNNYQSALTNTENDLYHQNIINRSGYMDELGVSFSGAYNDFLFVGFQLGFVSINYNEYKSYIENGFETNDDYLAGTLDEFVFNENLNVIGGGINYKLGFILKPIKFIRIGAAYHSKTNFQIEENWESSLTANFLPNKSYDEFFSTSFISPYGIGNFSLTTPSKSIASLAFIIAKRGLINIELEKIDYSRAVMNSTYYNYINENSNISNYYKNVNNLRIGTEWKFSNISFRAGLGIYESPFISNSIDIDPNHRIIQSFGVGYKSNQYFFDLALVNSNETKEHFMFEGSTASEISKSEQNIIISVGYKF